MKVFIVIPAYNEGGMIKNVLDDLHKHGYDNIVVVDDGSSDDTFKTASKHADTLRHVINRGQGAALQTGITYSLQKSADIIVTFDADGQHRTSEIEKMIKPIKNGEVDVTFGSRFLTKSDIPFLRKVYLKIGVVVMFVMYGVAMTDSHNGFRAFSRKAAQQIDIRSDGMEHASEIPEQVKNKNISFKEVPVHIDYTDYSQKHGQNFKLNAFRIFFRMLLKKLMR